MRAVLFDFDGVLVDSEPLHFRAMRDALVAEGFTIDEEEYWRHLLAYDDRGAIRIALERHGVPYDGARIEAVTRRKAEVFEARAGRHPVLPGRARAGARAAAARCPLAIASGARRAEIEAILTAGGLRDAFARSWASTTSRAGSRTPSPTSRRCAGWAPARPGCGPRTAWCSRTHPPGSPAGLAAGMKVVAVTNSYPAAKLTAAHRVVDSLAGLDSAGLRQLFAA